MLSNFHHQNVISSLQLISHHELRIFLYCIDARKQYSSGKNNFTRSILTTKETSLFYLHVRYALIYIPMLLVENYQKNISCVDVWIFGLLLLLFCNVFFTHRMRQEILRMYMWLAEARHNRFMQAKRDRYVDFACINFDGGGMVDWKYRHTIESHRPQNYCQRQPLLLIRLRTESIHYSYIVELCPRCNTIERNRFLLAQ